MRDAKEMRKRFNEHLGYHVSMDKWHGIMEMLDELIEAHKKLPNFSGMIAEALNKSIDRQSERITEMEKKYTNLYDWAQTQFSTNREILAQINIKLESICG